MSGRYIDVSRTCLQQRFFSRFEFNSTEELLSKVAGMQINLDTIAGSDDLRRGVYSGWAYWLLYLKGYLQYTECGTICSDNIYVDYLTRYYGPRAHDPGLQQYHDPGLHQVLADPQSRIERVAWRFRDTESFRKHASRDMSWLDGVAPVRVVVSDPPPQHPLLVYEIGSNIPLKASLVDGWHRLFSARLFGIPKLRHKVELTRLLRDL